MKPGLFFRLSRTSWRIDVLTFLSLCLHKGPTDFFPLLLSCQFPQLVFFSSFFFFLPIIWFFIFDQQPHCVPLNKQQSPSKPFLTTSCLFPSVPTFSLAQLPIPFPPATNSSSEITLILCHPFLSSAFSFPLSAVWFSLFLSASTWQRRSCWLYVFIVIKLGQSPFSGTESKWHSLARVHTAKLSSSHNRMALSFLPTGSSPWQVLLPEPCPDTVSEGTPQDKPKLCQGAC